MNIIGKIMPKTVSTESVSLSKEQIDFYWNNGYIVVRKLFDSKQLQVLKDRFQQICDDFENSRKFFSFVKDPQLYNENIEPAKYINKIQELLYDETFMRYSEDGRLLSIVSQLIGSDVTAINSMLINKPPGTQRHPPHQDLFYVPIRPAHKLVAVWTAIDPVYLQNGCLYVVPQSHLKEILYDHGSLGAEKKKFYLGILGEEWAAPDESRVHIEMAPGDTIFMHPYLVHGSGANMSQLYRKAITVHYASSSCHYIDVTGTNQQTIADQMEKELLRRGQDCSFIDMWKLKSKHIKGVRSNL